MTKDQEDRFVAIAGKASDIGLLVLDEGSFNDITILAHISARMSDLRGCSRPFGGVPVLLLLDFHQKQGVAGTQMHKALIIADLSNDLLEALKVNSKGRDKVTLTHFGADRIGVNLFRRFRRFNLVRQMRASDDPTHSEHLNQIRDIASEQPISEEILNSLQPLTAAALEKDPNLKFAKIVAMSWREIFPLTVMQITRWAKVHSLPVIQWPKELIGTAAGYLDQDETVLLYKNEACGLHERFVVGMPGTFTQNIDTQNGIVNGGNCTYVSLTMGDNQPSVEELVAAASLNDTNWIDGVLFVTLRTRPLSINVKMMVPKEQAERMKLKHYLLPDPPDYDPSGPSGLREVHLAVTLLPDGRMSEEYTPTSSFAAFDMPTKFKVRTFPLVPNFVVTDFKVQGTTEPCLISCLRQRRHLPPFTVTSFNVQFSRVRSAKKFYTLGLDKK